VFCSPSYPPQPMFVTKLIGMMLRALLAFLMLPVVIAGIVPWILLPNDRWRVAGTLWGCPIMLFGACVLLWTVRDFYVIGRGTLAPWDPPKALVVVGLFRVMRNPMYVGVVSFVAGLSVLIGSPLLGAYACLLAVGFHMRVVFYEEPTLSRQFGLAWTSYQGAVNRWWPKYPGGSADSHASGD
jgi:protein-S-isoprenylcysteine O-methyltransferase Ste14